jgi:hypothetical protein
MHFIIFASISAIMKLFITSRKSTGHDFTRYYSRNNNELPSYTIKILITRIPSHLYILSNTIRVVRHSESYNLPISVYVLYTEGLSRLPSRWNKWPSWVNIYLALIVGMSGIREKIFTKLLSYLEEVFSTLRIWRLRTYITSPPSSGMCDKQRKFLNTKNNGIVNFAYFRIRRRLMGATLREIIIWPRRSRTYTVQKSIFVLYIVGSVNLWHDFSLSPFSERYLFMCPSCVSVVIIIILH